MSKVMGKDVMLDIETLSVDSNAMVLSIAAVRFDLHTGETFEEFNIGLNLKDQLKINRVFDVDTLMWWMGQSEEARDLLVTKYQEGQKDELVVQLRKFNAWLKEKEVVRLWGNGATFDNVIVRNLYKACKGELFVPFWKDVDVRTIVSVHNIDRRKFEFTGVAHNAIDDCKFQIKYLTSAFKKEK